MKCTSHKDQYTKNLLICNHLAQCERPCKQLPRLKEFLKPKKEPPLSLPNASQAATTFYCNLSRSSAFTSHSQTPILYSLIICTHIYMCAYVCTWTPEINNGCLPQSISTLTSDSLGRWHTSRVPYAEDAEGGRLTEPESFRPSQPRNETLS